MNNYDVLVIGGGPGGYSFGISAAKKGLKVALFEREKLGGTCLNIGCIPTKYLVDKAKTMDKIRDLTGKEIFRQAGEFSFKKIQKEKDLVTQKLAGGVKALLQTSGVAVIQGEAVLKAGKVVSCAGKEYTGKHVVISTGSVPMMPPIPGSEHAIDSTGALNLPTIPRRMIIMGGGVIGLEFACVYASFGTAVTVVEMLSALLPGEQPEAVRLLASSLEKRGIQILTGAKIQRIEAGASGLQAHYQQGDASRSLEADYVVMASGREANLQGIDANELGLALTPNRCILTDRHQRTNLEGVYAIGDVAGGYQLAHVAYAEGEAALAHILKQERSTDAPVPKCIYTLPGLASVGLTVEAASKAGYQPVMGSFAYQGNGMALAEGSAGTVFVVMDRITQKTLGATIVGDQASELISFAALAVEQALTIAQWEQMIVAHPSLSEMVREAALDAFGRAVHKI